MGRIFQQSVRSDPKIYNRARSQSHETMSKANRQFHEALDEVEIGLVSGLRCPFVADLVQDWPESEVQRGWIFAKRATAPSKISP